MSVMRTNPMRAMRCTICGADTGLPLARYCAEHRAQRRAKARKYIHTEQTDAMIREAYPRRWSDREALSTVAKKFGWPRYAVVARACQLGIARTKEQPWSAEEIAILESYPWMGEDRIRVKLRNAGFIRSRVAVHLKMKRLRIRASVDGYSQYQLAQAFGIDPKMVRRWQKFGWIRGVPRGTDRTEAQGGDAYYFAHRSVYEFVMKHPDEVDLTKVEKFWFLDLVTKGAICR